MTQVTPRAAAFGRYLVAPRGSLRGLSATGSPTTNQIAAAAVGSATSIGTALAAGAALTVPLIGAAFAGVALGIQAILNSGCGQTCIITSNWANQAEAALQKNKDEYFAIPAPRPQSAKTAALANFDKVWAYLVQECSAPQLGSAGQRCISDRQEGACKWQSNGACWNWFSGYRDPISADQTISDQAYSASLAQGGTASSTSPAVASGGTMSDFLLPAAGLLLLVLGMSQGGMR